MSLTLHVTIKMAASAAAFTQGQKKKLFGCPPLPAPNFWKLEKRFTVQKYTAPNFQNSKKFFFSLRILIF